MASDDEVDGQRRRLLRQALALGLLAGGGKAVAAVARPSSPLPGAQIRSMYGPVWVNGLRATPGTHIGPDDHLETGHEAQLIATIGTDALLLRGNTELQLALGSSPRPLFQLVSGALLASFGRRDRGIELRTPTATLGIRGTTVYAVAAEDRSYFCPCYGQTQLTALTNAKVGEALVAHHHDAARYVLTRPRSGRLILPAPFSGHNDAELMTLEAAIGRQAPFAMKSPTGVRR